MSAASRCASHTGTIDTTITNSATVSSTTLDPGAGNNADSETTTVTTVPQFANLSLSQTDTPDPVNAAAALVYTLNVANAGPNPASNVTVTDTPHGDLGKAAADAVRQWQFTPTLLNCVGTEVLMKVRVTFEAGD